MIGIQVNIDDKAVQLTLQRLGEQSAQVSKTALESIGMFLVSKTKDNILGHTGPDGAWPRSGLSDLWAGERTWRDIMASVSYRVDARQGGGAVAVGASHIAAAVRQQGTVGKGGSLPDIVPVKKKALTIPLSDAASKASYNGIDARTAFPGAFILEEQHGAMALGPAVIARKIGGRTDKKTGQKVNQKLELLYLLVKKVAIRPHRYLPVDGSGNLAPATLWQEINQLLVDAFMPPQAAGGPA